MQPAFFLIVTAISILVIGAAIVRTALKHAPEGFENAAGFQLGRSPAPVNEGMFTAVEDARSATLIPFPVTSRSRRRTRRATVTAQ